MIPIVSVYRMVGDPVKTTSILYRTLILTLAATVTTGIARAQNPYADRVAAMGDDPLVYVDDSVITPVTFGAYLEGAGVLPSGRRQADLDTLESSLQWLIDQTIVFNNVDTAAIFAMPNSNRRARWREAAAAGPLTYAHFIRPQLEIPDSVVEKFYRDSLKTMFTTPRQRELRHILISPRWHQEEGKRIQYRTDIESAKKTADSLKAAIEAGAPFDSLAGALSADSASRVKNGYLGWVFPGNTVHDFDTAAFNAEVGEIRGPVKTMYGYHLIKVEGERPESTIVLNAAIRKMIEAQLGAIEGRELGRQWSDSVVNAADWRFNDDVLSDTLHETPDTAWVVIVNHRDTMSYAEWKGAWMLFQRSKGIKGAGTLEQKHTSLKATAFPYLYLHAAEDGGFADAPEIIGERRQYARSTALRMAYDDLEELQRIPDSVLTAALADTVDKDSDPPLHLQFVRARDTASIWGAYRHLVAGDDMATVAGWYHDNLREVRAGKWDLGWVHRDALPADIAGAVWILNVGKFTRPLKHGDEYYIYKLVDRKSRMAPAQKARKIRDHLRREYLAKGLAEWRKRLRSSHTVRIDPTVWRRVVQVWKK